MKVVGAAGLQPATLCLEGVIISVLPITMVVSKCYGSACLEGFERSGECSRFLSISARGPRNFHRSADLLQISGRGNPILVVRVAPVPRVVDGFAALPVIPKKIEKNH